VSGIEREFRDQNILVNKHNEHEHSQYRQEEKEEE
jgi:hypothetical protein